MGAGSSGMTGGFVAGDTVLHRLAPHPKLLSTLGFAVVVVATPVHAREAPAAFAGYLVLVLAAAAAGAVRPRRLLRGLVLEVPFVLFAVLLPFVAQGPRVTVLGLSVSASGLAAGGGILVKATLSVLAATVLAATTEPRALAQGLQRLRLPQILVQILTFMLRYADVVADELRRMRIARESRAFAGGGLRGLRVVGATAGALFVRAYERGERVHLAMLSRGYQGQLPATPADPAPLRHWLLAALLPGGAAAVLALGTLGA